MPLSSIPIQVMLKPISPEEKMLIHQEAKMGDWLKKVENLILDINSMHWSSVKEFF